MNVEERLAQVLWDHAWHLPHETCACGWDGDVRDHEAHVVAMLLEQFDITPKGGRSILWLRGRNVWSTEWLAPVVKLIKKED